MPPGGRPTRQPCGRRFAPIREARTPIRHAAAAAPDFLRDEHGATAAEYSLLVALTACVAMIGMVFFGDSLRREFQHIVDTFTGATGP